MDSGLSALPARPARRSLSLRLLILFAFLLVSVEGRSKCVRAKGRVVCPTDPDRQFNVLVKLLDKDPLLWETDDEMQTSWTDEFGNYTLEGCGEDFGYWNDPDPYIYIEHRCPEPGHSISISRRYRTITIERMYLPQVVQVPTVHLDEACEGC